MKKLLFLALAAVSFSLASCGGDATMTNEGGTGNADAPSSEASVNADSTTITDTGAGTASTTGSTTTSGGTTAGSTTGTDAGTTSGQ